MINGLLLAVLEVDNIYMDKRFIRKILNNRNKHTDSYISQKSNLIKHNLFNQIDFNSIDTVHIYLSKDKEVNTWNIITHIFKHYKTKIIVPKVKGIDLENYYLVENTGLVKNTFGIYEPIEGKLCDKDSFDLIIIPLLCVNKEGYRIGYGKGYYDRFLSKYSGLKVGLALEDPIAFEAEDHDVKLDRCIFPRV